MIDSHCHLDDRSLFNSRQELLDEAKSSGVELVINIGINLKSSRQSLAMAEQFDTVYATVGVHPHDARTLTADTLSELRELCGHRRVIGVGEIGLDYYRDLSPRDVQKKAFEQQLQLAADLEMPIVIHTRESFEDTLAMVKHFSGKLSGVFHCFPGDRHDAERVFEIGFIISVGGIVTFKNSTMARVAGEVPLDRMILETDAPYLAPVPFRGKRNRPAYVRYVYEKLAQLRGEPLSQVEKTIDRTCRKLFGLEEIFEG